MVGKILFFVGWLFMFLGALFLCAITFEWYIIGYDAKVGFVFFRTDVGFLLAKQDGVRSPIWMTAFYFHVTSCIICLMVGPFQFISAFRRKYKYWHRLLGKYYLMSIFFAGFPSGLYMAFFANGGLPAQLGFTVLSFLWIGATVLAYLYIRAGNVKAHMAWTARSYALTFSAVTLRLWTPILSAGFELDHNFVIAITAWINWIPNLIITEMIIRYANKRL
jgi:hypothetical protein